MTKSFRLASGVPVVAVLAVVLLVSAAAAGLASGAREQGTPAKAEVNKVTMALGDIETVETLNLLIAIEHLREKGMEIELVSFKSEDIGSQAVVNGQAQIGIGTPYALIQNVRAPVRVFLQLASLLFFPVVNTEYYQDWKDLDGEEIVVHSRTSGTLAIVNLMAQREGIEYSTISYVPGSEVRALALLQGNIKATILDAFNKEFVMKEAPGRFAVLPLPDLQASDEALYANTAFLEENPQRCAPSSRRSSTSGGRSTATRPTWWSSGRSTASSPTCPPSWRRRSCPTTSWAPRTGCSPTTAAGRTRPGRTWSSTPWPARSRDRSRT